MTDPNQKNSSKPHGKEVWKPDNGYDFKKKSICRTEFQIRIVFLFGIDTV